jgi:hypothetical protein
MALFDSAGQALAAACSLGRINLETSLLRPDRSAGLAACQSRRAGLLLAQCLNAICNWLLRLKVEKGLYTEGLQRQACGGARHILASNCTGCAARGLHCSSHLSSLRDLHALNRAAGKADDSDIVRAVITLQIRSGQRPRMCPATPHPSSES